MSDLNIVIIDDEPSALMTLKLLISKIAENYNVVAEISSVKQAMEKLPKLDYDVLLLDIELIDGTGFDILAQLPSNNANVIFTTAYDNYAIKAFKENAVDYLLKPINLEELKKALSKCRPITPIPQDYKQLLESIKADLQGVKIAVKSLNQVELINSNDIEFIRASGSYTTIYLNQGKSIVSTKSLRHYETLLNSSQFFKINRNEMVNLNLISSYKKNSDFGEVIMKNGEKLGVSRRRKTEFTQWIKSI